MDINRRYSPEVMFLSETHLDNYPADCLRRRLQMDSKIVNPTTSRSGGVILFWKREVKIEQIYSHPNYIDVKVMESSSKIWRFTGIYGEPKWEDKYKTWDRLRGLKNDSNLPWIVLGDFNEIMYSHEKEGGNPRPSVFMQAFCDALADCELEDLGFSGDPFTWKRGRIRERLDRVVANGDWMTMHQGAKLQHLEFIRSDHRPLLLDTDFQVPAVQSNRSKKFEAKWLKERGFQELVE
jgi:hypothetical protein